MSNARKTALAVFYVRATRRTAGHWKTRLHLAADGARPWLHFYSLNANTPDGRALAEQRAAEKQIEADEKGLIGADFGLGTQEPRKAPHETSAPEAATKWVESWLASRTAKGLTSVRENGAHYRKHIAPAMADKHVRDWTSDDMRRLAAALDAKVQGASISWKTGWNIWATACRMCRDACASKIEALRCRSENPARDVEGPDRGASPAKQFLYPSEFLTFVAYDDAPLAWRRHVALAIYLFPRAGELRVLRWEDVDLVHGTIHIHRAADRTSESGETKATKTGHARRFAIEPNLLPLLEVMQQESGGEGLVVDLPSERALARGLRRWLWNANVRRTELHTSTRSSRKVVFHDLRATGATWMAIRGDEPMKVMQRCGHENIDTTMGYVRTAEALRVGFGEPFPPLPVALLRSRDGENLSRNLSRVSPEMILARDHAVSCGVDGTRTRGLRRDRPAL
jgi:integrase